jgi:hypothetical protein
MKKPGKAGIAVRSLALSLASLAICAGQPDPVAWGTHNTPASPGNSASPTNFQQETASSEGGPAKPSKEPSTNSSAPITRHRQIQDSDWEAVVGRIASGASDSIVLSEFAVESRHLLRLESAPTVRELILDRGLVDDAGLELIARHCRQIEHLRLRHSPIGDLGANSLKKMKTLKILNLPQSRLTSSGLRHLRSLSQLEQIRLGGPHLNDDAVAELAALPSMRSLHLIRPNLTDKSMEYLANAAKLSSLYLDGCEFSTQAWQRLKDAKPDLHVHLDQHHPD